MRSLRGSVVPRQGFFLGRLGISAGAIAIAAALGYAGWLWYVSRPGGEAPPPAPAASTPAVHGEEGPSHPVAVDPSQPLPALAESDGPFVEALTGIAGLHSVSRLLVPSNHIRNIVATVDALAREKVSRRIFPLEPVPGRFRTESRGGGEAFGAANARRYDAIVRMIAAVRPEQAAAAYRRFYPLFQQAYRELGYPKGYFNDRLVEVLDDLAQVPDLAFPIPVVQPNVMYKYADPDLESLPAGQKMLLRLGPENLAVVVPQIKAFRREIGGG
jgi:hypothetical protein